MTTACFSSGSTDTRSTYFFEPPAGLLDKPDEDPLVAAQRELAEEAGLRARHWHVLVDFCNTPGGSTETFRCYLARGLSRLPEGRHQTGEAEEVDLPQAWLTLDDARLAVLDGRLQNPTTVTGVLAAWSARATGWDTLRPADAPGRAASGSSTVVGCTGWTAGTPRARPRRPRIGISAAICKGHFAARLRLAWMHPLARADRVACRTPKWR